MAVRKNKTRTTRKKSAQKSWFIPGIGRLIVFFLLFFLLVFSLCSAGYVIFFRTVFAQEIMVVLKNGIVFEEPDPPEVKDLPIIPVEKSVDIVSSTPFPEVFGDETTVSLPKVAIIVDDIGYQQTLGQKFIDLPIALTYSFLPFAPYTKELENTAYNAGKTVFLHLPLQPQSAKFNPGPGALLVADSVQAQQDKLKKCLSEVPHAVGVNNHMGSQFTQNKVLMERIMQELDMRSLAFVDSYTTAKSVGLESAQALGLKTARRHVFLDNTLSYEHICGQLEKLVNIAKKTGVGIGIAHPHEETLQALSGCSPDYKEEVEYVSVMDVL